MEFQWIGNPRKYAKTFDLPHSGSWGLPRPLHITLVMGQKKTLSMDKGPLRTGQVLCRSRFGLAYGCISNLFLARSQGSRLVLSVSTFSQGNSTPPYSFCANSEFGSAIMRRRVVSGTELYGVPSVHTMLRPCTHASFRADLSGLVCVRSSKG